MNKYTKEQIDSTIEGFRSRGYSEVKVDLGKGRIFSYFVLPQSLEPRLPHFVFRATGDEKDGYVFGIADSVPEEFRPYAVLHELVEFTEIGIDTEGRCRGALDIELSLVPDRIKRDYINMKREFFSDLINYCQDKPGYTDEDIKEFRRSLSRLEELSDGG